MRIRLSSVLLAFMMLGIILWCGSMYFNWKYKLTIGPVNISVYEYESETDVVKSRKCQKTGNRYCISDEAINIWLDIYTGYESKTGSMGYRNFSFKVSISAASIPSSSKIEGSLEGIWEVKRAIDNVATIRVEVTESEGSENCLSLNISVSLRDSTGKIVDTSKKLIEIGRP